MIVGAHGVGDLGRAEALRPRATRTLALILKSLRTSFVSISLMESQEGSNIF